MASPASFTAPQARTIAAGPPGRLLSAAPKWTTAHGRLISAGVEPEPGVYAAAPAWRTAGHWLTAVQVDAARDVEGLREHHVSAGTVVMVARVMARYADTTTGRDCRPTNDRVMAEAHVSWSTLKRARAWLRDRAGLIVEVIRGKSIMSRTERLRAWKNGSSHRQLASEFALTLPRRLAAVIHTATRRPVRHGLPPTTSEGGRCTTEISGFFTSTNRDRRIGAARRAPQQAGAKPRTPAQVRTARLTAALQARVGWLAGVSPRRLTVLARFAAQGWTERDVRTAIEGVLRARGWTIPAAVTQPPAYLAALLRDVDPADRPGALADAMLAEELARRAEIDARSRMPECAHGVNGGNVPTSAGHRVCPLCRRGSTS